MASRYPSIVKFTPTESKMASWLEYGATPEVLCQLGFSNCKSGVYTMFKIVRDKLALHREIEREGYKAKLTTSHDAKGRQMRRMLKNRKP